jgi:hypothetical protein
MARRAPGVGDAHRVEYLTLHIADEKAVRGGGARGWPGWGARCMNGSMSRKMVKSMLL